MAPPPDDGTPDYQSEIAQLRSDVATLKNKIASTAWGPFASTQKSGTSAQFVGNGTAQLLSPSFNLASLGVTGLKIDEAGISLFGKQIWTSPWSKDKHAATTEYVDKAVNPLVKTVDFNAEIGKLVTIAAFDAAKPDFATTTSLDDKIGEVTAKVGEVNLRIDRVDNRFGGIGSQNVAQAIGTVKGSLTREVNARKAFEVAATGKFDAIEAHATAAREKLVGGQSANPEQAATATEQLKTLQLAVAELAEAIG